MGLVWDLPGKKGPESPGWVALYPGLSLCYLPQSVNMLEEEISVLEEWQFLLSAEGFPCSKPRLIFSEELPSPCTRHPQRSSLLSFMYLAEISEHRCALHGARYWEDKDFGQSLLSVSSQSGVGEVREQVT